MEEIMQGRKSNGITRREFIAWTMAASAVAAMPVKGYAKEKPLSPLPKIDKNRDVLLYNCNVLDVRTGKLIPNAHILYQKGKIVAVGTGEVNLSHAQKINLEGAYVIPGLIDGHCHTTASPVYGSSIWGLPKLVKEQRKHFPACINGGVTTVRDLGAFPPILHGYINDINKGKLTGPRVVYCNSIININGGHPDIKPTDITIFADLAKPFMGMLQANFKNDEELKEALEENTRDASFIKLTMDNLSIFPGKGEIPVYSDEQLKMIFDYAEKKGLPVSCHNHRKWGYDRAMKYPFNSIEHTIGDAYHSDDEVGLMVKKNVSIVPTLTIAQCFLIEDAYETVPAQFRNDFIDNEVKIRNEYVNNEGYKDFDPKLNQANIDSMKLYKTMGKNNLYKNKKFLVDPDLYYGIMLHAPQNIKKMKDAGVNIGVGIDAGMPFAYFGGYYRELELLTRVGFTNAEVLRCATLNNAKILCMEDKIGTLEPGKCADMVVYTENPLQKIEICRTPKAVFRDGDILLSSGPLKIDDETQGPA
jgi:imidazolonepropionase-like amidohydrolase